VFENRVLKRIYGTSRDKVTGWWRALHTEELYDFYSTPHTFRVNKSRRKNAQSMWHVWEIVQPHRSLVRRPDGRRQLGRCRRTWEDNIKKYLQKVGGVYGLD
jgi:hypothetical protein